MDPLTHTACGLFLSRAGLKRWTPLATPILLLAANAPDCDIVALAGGPLSYLHYHRHLTHSLAALPLMALLPVVLVRLAARKPVAWWGAWAAALVAVGAHLALDLTNSYGVRLLLPFSARWLRLDLTNVVDLWIWAALLVAVAAPFIGRLVGSEITSGTERDRHYGRGFAVFGLAFLLMYNCGRAVLHTRAVAVLESRVYRERPAARTAALPDAAAPWRWRGLVETDEFYAVADLSLLEDFDPTGAVIFHKPEPDAAIDAAGRTPTFQEFLRFSQFPLWQVSPVPEPENGRLVEVVDMRFGTPRQPGFMAGAIVDSRQQVRDAYLRFGRRR
jgi:inner membrane protein